MFDLVLNILYDTTVHLFGREVLQYVLLSLSLYLNLALVIIWGVVGATNKVLSIIKAALQLPRHVCIKKAGFWLRLTVFFVSMAYSWSLAGEEGLLFGLACLASLIINMAILYAACEGMPKRMRVRVRRWLRKPVQGNVVDIESRERRKGEA